MLAIDANNAKKIFIGFLLLMLLFFLNAISSILLPFIMGIIVAYLLDPVTNKLVDKKISRPVAAALVMILFVIIILMVISLLFPLLSSQTELFLRKIPAYASALWMKAYPYVSTIKENVRKEGELPTDLHELIRNHSSEILNFLINMGSKVISSSFAIFNIIGLIFISPIVAFYLLKDWPSFVKNSKALIPPQYAGEAAMLMHRIDEALAGFIRGQLLVCTILAAYYAFLLTLLGLDAAIAVGIFTGLMTTIPYIGWTMGAFFGMSIALAQYGDSYLYISLVAAVFLGGQVLESNFLTPNLIGSKIGLHPVWIIFALLAGGSLFGFIGVLLAVPVAAILGILIRYTLVKIKE